MSTVVDARSVATRSRSAANSPLVHTGADTSTSTAASAQSSSSAVSEPSGFAPSIRRVRGSSCRSTVLTGEATLSRTSRRVPAPIAAVLLDRCANTRRSTAVPASTKAGKPRTACPPTVRSTTARQLVEVVGPGAQSRAFQLAADRCGDGVLRGRREPLLQDGRDPCPGRPPCRPRTRRRTSPAGAAAACPGRMHRSAPERRCGDAVRAATPPAAALRPASIAASTARAVSGAGTKLRRRSFGSELDQRGDELLAQRGHLPANSSPPRRASTSTGTCTVTPSSAAPGSNR